MRTDDQIREIATDAILALLDESRESGIVGWLDKRYDYLSREDVNRVYDAVGDAKVEVAW